MPDNFLLPLRNPQKWVRRRSCKWQIIMVREALFYWHVRASRKNAVQYRQRSTSPWLTVPTRLLCKYLVLRVCTYNYYELDRPCQEPGKVPTCGTVWSKKIGIFQVTYAVWVLLENSPSPCLFLAHFSAFSCQTILFACAVKSVAMKIVHIQYR